MDTPTPTFALLQEAVAFAARVHHGQLRKDRQTPYASHPFRVCLVVRHVFGVEDLAVLTAAVLHDTIEDTTTDFDDLHERFGEQVAGWVAALSKDKRLQDGPREEAYRTTLSAAPWQVKVCKLADLYDNLTDVAHLTEKGRVRTLQRAGLVLRALCDPQALDDPQLPPAVRRAYDIVTRLWQDLSGGVS
jgi:(p)ppGpp synthase/HD superfamily hydrolase